MRSKLLIAAALVALGAAAPASAQDRSPGVRQSLVDLAYVLGEVHALRQACLGAEDQFWRARMIRMVEAEQPDAALDRRLKEAFNTGYASRQSEFPECTGAARRAEVAALNKGQSLAGQLSKVMNTVKLDALPTQAEIDADPARGQVTPRPATR